MNFVPKENCDPQIVDIDIRFSQIQPFSLYFSMVGCRSRNSKYISLPLLCKPIRKIDFDVGDVPNFKKPPSDHDID